MSVEIHILDGPLPPIERSSAAGAGASLVFEGIVRELENGRPIVALDYQVYSPMAERQISDLAERLVRYHALIRLAAWHSRGRVPVGAISFRVVIESAHRRPALAAMTEFIDRFKADVPIWKQPVWADATPPPSPITSRAGHPGPSARSAGPAS